MTEEAELEIRFIGDLTRLQVRPGDKFVLSTDKSISSETAARLREMASSALDGATVIVLSDGLKLGVIGTEEV